MTQDKDSVKVGTNFKWFLGVCAIVLIILIGFLAFKPSSIPEGFLSEEDVDLAITNAVAIGVADAVESKDLTITDLTQQIADLQIVKEEEKISLLGYLVDGLLLETAFGDVYSDRELNLFDGEVEFDGDDYDAEETFEIVNDRVEMKANENDFLGNPYLVVQEGAISYSLVFENSLNISLIEEDETLVFNFLGNEVEVSDWNVDEITFSMGEKHTLNEGESVNVGGLVINVINVLEEEVQVSVGGEVMNIGEGDMDRANGLEIMVEHIGYEPFAGGTQRVTLIIGKDIEMVAKDGHEYEEDSIWEWSISPNSIGLVLVEEFVELDEDEDYNALAVGEKVCLPNDYVCVVFNGLAEEDTEEYSFELDGDFVEVKGNFQSGLKDYDRIYIYTNGSIYEDDNTDNYIGKEVQLGNTEMKLVPGENEFIKIENDLFPREFVVNYKDLIGEPLQYARANDNADLLVDWDCNGKEDNFLTNYGILVENPEDSCEDQEFSLAVPMKQLEGSISLQ